MNLSRILMGWINRESPVERAPLRRSTRLPLAINVIITGKSEDGQPFKEQTRTVDVGRYGARMATRHLLGVGTEVLIENRALERTAIAKVVWQGTRSSPQEPVQIGVELLDLFEPERIWGVKSPPRDWQEASPTPTLAQELEYVAARDRARLTEFSDDAEAHSIGLEPTPSTRPEVPAIGQAPQTASSMQKECVLAVLEDLGGAADRTASSVEQSSGMSVAELAGPVAQALQGLAETARRSADEVVHSINLAAEAAVARLQAVEKEIEASFQATAGDSQKRLAELSASGAEALQHSAHTLLEDLREQYQNVLYDLRQTNAKQVAAQLQEVTDELLERSFQRLQKQASDTAEKLDNKVRASEAGLAGKAVKQLEGLVQASLASLTKAAEESRGELAETARLSADEAVRSINAATGSALGRFQTLRENVEAGFENMVQRRLAEPPAFDTDGVERKAEALFKGFEAKLQGTLNGLEQKGAKQLAAQLQKVTDDLLERSAKEFQKQASDAIEKVSEKGRASQTGLADEARKQIEGLVQASLKSFTKATEESRNDLAETARLSADEAVRSITAAAESAVGRFQTLQEKMEASLQTTAGGSQKRLEELSVSNAEGIQRKADALLKNCQSQLQNTLNGFEQKGAKDITDQLQKTASDLAVRFAQQLQKRANDTVEKLSEELNTSEAGLIQKAGKQLQNLTQASLESLTEAAEQSCVQLRQMAKELVAHSREREVEYGKSLKKQGETIQRQIQDLFPNALEKRRYEFRRVEAAPARRPRGWQVALALAAIAPTVLFIYLSARPVMRLRDEPPAAFFDAHQGLSGKQRATAERLARAYWDWASQHLQRKYPFGTKLPNAPPPGFEVDGRDFPKGLEGDVAKLRYWHKLCEVWGQPQAWETSYGWNR